MMSTKNGATLYFNLKDSTYEVVNGSREDILSALREDMEMEFLESLN